MTRESERQVAITGIGAICPLGIGADEYWANLRAGKSGIRKITHLSYSPVPHGYGGDVPQFNSKKIIKERKSTKVMCREIELGVAAATLAMDHAGLKEGVVEPERIGVDFGANLMLSPPEDIASASWTCSENETHTFDYARWGDAGKGLSAMYPLWLLKFLPNMPACHIGIAADARGPNNSLTMEEASGNVAMGEAFRIIARGSADIMISGATGTRVHAVKSMHAKLWDALATEPVAEKACRPFDLNRTGQVIAEGAGSLILEEAGHAEKRGAKIYGYVLGAGAACVADRKGVADYRKAMALALKKALDDAGLKPSQIGHINAHGLSDKAYDVAEAGAILDVFGSVASEVPVTAIKSYIGNSGSGCGPLEVAASLMSLSEGIILPTLNYEVPDPSCPLRVVHGGPLSTTNKVFAKVNVSRLGQASALVLRAA